jgi:hypothetical protein
MRYLYDIMDIPHQLPELEKLDNLHMRHQPNIVTKKGGCYDYFNLVKFICAFPMQRAFVKVLIFQYGFCLERGLLLRISRSVVNLICLVFV